MRSIIVLPGGKYLKELSLKWMFFIFWPILTPFSYASVSVCVYESLYDGILHGFLFIKFHSRGIGQLYTVIRVSVRLEILSVIVKPNIFMIFEGSVLVLLFRVSIDDFFFFSFLRNNAQISWKR